MLISTGKADIALTLCKEIALRAPQARWALRRSGFLLAAAERFEEGLIAFQSALKTDVTDAVAWEGLASCYQNLGRFTAALKAYARALELQPGRPYARIQCGTIHMALGSFAESIAQFEAALEIAPTQPAALLGAAESLAASAGMHSRQGALGAAADELARAAGYILRCTEKHGTLQAAWKLLGDVLVLHHAVTPSAQHPSIPANTSGGGGGGGSPHELEGQLDAWRRRVEAMRQGRRAYAKVLHLNPSQPAAWQDAAFAYHHEAQLLRAHPAVAPAGSGAPSLEGLTAAAERVARAGLRLDGASPDLWAALGAVAAEPATREYALSRALQLDPKCVPAWVTLARLYAEHGASGPAVAALQHARSQEPAVPAIWEAMADVAALSSTGAKDHAEYQEHAHGLGAGPAGLLGFAESAIRAGRSLDGPVYAAAKKAAHMQPLNPAAHNVLGLASEARGDCALAVASYKLALRLALVTRDPDAIVQHPHTISNTSTSLQTALQLNLARALTRGGGSSEAVQLYEELEVTAELYDQPPAWLAYAAAKLATGDTGGAELALQSASEPGTPAQLLAQAVCASMQLHCMAGRPHQALQHLQQQLVLLRGARVLMRDMEGLWETAVAGAAAARDWQLLQKALLSAQTWAAEADDGSAAFLAKLHGLEAAGRLAAEQAQQAARQYSRAVHLCPTDAGLRVGLAGAVLMQPAAAASSPEVALRLLDSPAVVAAAVAGNRTASVAPAGKVLPIAVLEASTAAVLAAERRSPEQSNRRLSAAAHGVHESPANSSMWHLAAVTAKKAAAEGGTEDSSLRAWRWCRAAEEVLGRAAAAAP